MKKITKLVLAALMTAVMVLPAVATDWYVSANVGKKKNEGTSKSSPLKAVWNAIEKAAPGDRIYVAGGNYTGKAGCGFVLLDKALEMYGGYDDTFSTRDVAKNITSFRPTNEMNGTLPPNGTFEIRNNGKPGKIVIDGFVFDHSDSNAYHETKGKPEGVSTGVWLEPPAKGNFQYGSSKKYLLYTDSDGELNIQNCLFLNSSWYSIGVNHAKGVVNIKNNVIINSRLMGVNVASKSGTPFATRMNFEYNTLLFTWSRTDDLGDMGYGIRALSKVDANISHNILGLSIMSAFDNSMNNRKGEQKVTLDDNIFFLNRRGDVSYTVSPSIKYLKVDSDAFEDFEDVDGIESCEDNTSLSDPSVFKGIIDKAYLEGFLNVSYTEQTDFNPNSEANQLRAALGMNKQGTIKTKVSMYANKYPYSDNIWKFFGAVKGHGAQTIK